MTMLAHSRK